MKSITIEDLESELDWWNGQFNKLAQQGDSTVAFAMATCIGATHVLNRLLEDAKQPAAKSERKQ